MTVLQSWCNIHAKVVTSIPFSLWTPSHWRKCANQFYRVIFHYTIILFPIYTLMHVQSNNVSISYFIPYLTYICSYLSSYVEVGGMWKHLVFPWKYFYKHSSEQLSRQAAWDIVMYTPEVKELKEKQCSCSSVHIFILCRSRGDVGTASFP